MSRALQYDGVNMNGKAKRSYCSSNLFFIRIVILISSLVLVISPSYIREVNASGQNLIIVNAKDDLDDGSCDSTHCSLREAINSSNNHQGPDKITFDPQVFPSHEPGIIEIMTGGWELVNSETTIDASGAGVIIDGSNSLGEANGFIIRSSGNTIRGIRLENIPNVAVLIGEIRLENFEIYDNTIDNVTVVNSGYGISGLGRGDGMWIMAYCQGCKATRNTIVNCRIENGADDGIEVWSYAGGVVDDNFVVGNTLLNNAEVGIEIDVHGPGGSTNRNTVAYNLVTGTKEQAGIYINPWQGGSANGNLIYKNTVVDNTQIGIGIGPGGSGTTANDNKIINNAIEQHDYYEIVVGAGDFAEAVGNLIIGNTITGTGATDFARGITVYSNSNFVFLNSIVNKLYTGQDEGSNNHWDFNGQGNYWSDYTGLDENGDGIGDTPYPVPTNGVDNYPLMAPYTYKMIYLPVVLHSDP